MNIRETRVLLQTLRAVDRRTVDEDAVNVWTVLLEDVDPRDGMAGLKHLLQTEPDLMIKPGHVLAAAKQKRAERIRAAQLDDARRRDIWGNILGSPEAIEAQKRFEDARAERWEAPPPPPVKVVPSPFREWERRRREGAKKAENPLITDVDRIREMETNRRIAKEYLQAMMDNPTLAREYLDDETAVEAEEGV